MKRVPAGVDLVQAWEHAYRRYGTASEFAARAGRGDHGGASAMADASRSVASAWRALAKERQDLAWWLLAAVESAAEAFEDQARYWQEEEGHEGGVQRDLDPGRGSGRRDTPAWFDVTPGSGVVPRPGQSRDHSAGRSGPVAEVRAIPSTAPRRGGATGGVGRRSGGVGA